MSQATIQKVRRLLAPTYDEEEWYRDVMALDKGEAIPILIGIVKSESESVRARRQAILILSLLGDESAIDTFLEMLSAADPGLRAHAAQALGRFKTLSDAAVQRLITALQDSDEVVRERSAKALEQLRRPEALAALHQMRASDPAVSNREVAEGAIKVINETE